MPARAQVTVADAGLAQQRFSLFERASAFGRFLRRIREASEDGGAQEALHDHHHLRGGFFAMMSRSPSSLM